MQVVSRDDSRYVESITDSLQELELLVPQLWGLFDIIAHGHTKGLIPSDNKTVKQYNALVLLLRITHTTSIGWNKQRQYNWNMAALQVGSLGLPQPLEHINWDCIYKDEDLNEPLFSKTQKIALKKHNIKTQ